MDKIAESEMDEEIKESILAEEPLSCEEELSKTDSNSAAAVEPPEAEEDKTIKIHASVPDSWRDVSVWCWDYKSSRDASTVWPGIVLEPEGNGWFAGEIPAWVNSFILCGNRGSVQSEKTAFRPKELWVSVTGDLSCDVSYSMPDLISVHARVPVFWRTPHLWAWNGDNEKNAFYGWPGGLMIKDGDEFRLSAPAWIDHIIINGKDGWVKTEDIEVKKGKNIYINVNRQGDYALSYNKMPAAPDEPEPEYPSEKQEVIYPEKKESKPAPFINKKKLKIVAAIGAAALISAAAAGIIVYKAVKRK